MTVADATSLGEFTCHSCGQKRVFADDLSLKNVAHETFEELTHLDGRLLSSIRLLLLRPGQLTLDFLEGRRKRHVHPFRLFLVVAAIAFFSLRHAGFSLPMFARGLDPKQRAVLIEPAARKAGLDWETFAQQRDKVFQNVFQPAEMAAEVVVIGLILWLLFRRRYPFVGQHLVFVLHYSSFGLALNTAGHLLKNGPAWLLTPMLVLVTAWKYVYMLLAVRRVYQEKVAVSVAKSLAAYAGLFLGSSIAFLIALFSALLF
jgi:hypothetical protein